MCAYTAKYFAEEDAVFISVSQRYLYRVFTNSTTPVLIAEHTMITNNNVRDSHVAYDNETRRIFWAVSPEAVGGLYIVNLNETDGGNVLNETTMTLVSAGCTSDTLYCGC